MKGKVKILFKKKKKKKSYARIFFHYGLVKIKLRLEYSFMIEKKKYILLIISKQRKNR